MNIDEIKAFTDGDTAVRLGHRRIYDWHLTHVSESKCNFTYRSVKHAIKYIDIKLLKQLCDFNPNICKDIDYFRIYRCKNIQILEIVLPLAEISFRRFVEYGNIVAIDYILSNKLCTVPDDILEHIHGYDNVIDYLSYKNYLTDEMIHTYANKCIDIHNIKYLADKGYKWSYKHLSYITKQNYVELMSYMLKNGNNDEYYAKHPITYSYYHDIYNRIIKGDMKMYELLCSIDKDFKKSMIEHNFGHNFDQYIQSI